jgi:hypothetical protein
VAILTSFSEGEHAMKQSGTVSKQQGSRRKFLKNGFLGAGAATIGASLLSSPSFADNEDHLSHPITKGDIAILTFLQALEQVETDLWLQYSELGGVQDGEVSGVNGGSPLYQAALQLMDGDMSQYIHDNTDDEISHARFLGKYLESKGASPVNLDPFRNLPSVSPALGAKQIGRLTNLTQLTVDTSFWSRYRSVTNPDFDPGAPFAPAVPSLLTGKFTAIPRTADDLGASTLSPLFIDNRLRAIAFTAGFHFAFIEQGGSSLYPTLAQHVTNLEVLRILLSIGPSETMHFQTWQDKAGNAGSAGNGNPPFTFTDPVNNSTVTFNDLTLAPPAGAGTPETDPESLNGDTLQANLIMPEPTHFLDPSFGPVAIVRPTSLQLNGARAAVQGFVDDGLFIGHTVNGKSDGFVELLFRLADAADAARRPF